MNFLDNQIGGCIALFITITLSIWYVKPRLIFNEDGNANTLDIGSFNVNLFGIFIVFIAIIVYYVYAMIRYN